MTGGEALGSAWRRQSVSLRKALRSITGRKQEALDAAVASIRRQRSGHPRRTQASLPTSDGVYAFATKAARSMWSSQALASPTSYPCRRSLKSITTASSTRTEGRRIRIQAGDSAAFRWCIDHPYLVDGRLQGMEAFSVYSATSCNSATGTRLDRGSESEKNSRQRHNAGMVDTPAIAGDRQ